MKNLKTNQGARSKGDYAQTSERAMEPDIISKNGAGPKSRKSRENYNQEEAKNMRGVYIVKERKANGEYHHLSVDKRSYKIRSFQSGASKPHIEHDSKKSKLSKVILENYSEIILVPNNERKNVKEVDYWVKYLQDVSDKHAIKNAVGDSQANLYERISTLQSEIEELKKKRK